MSVLEQVEAAPPDPIFGLGAQFKKDERKNKVDLTVGIYHNQKLQTETMGCIAKAESKLIETEKNKAYLPMGGKEDFLEVSRKLVFGEAYVEKERSRIGSVQSIGGTNALKLGGDLWSANINKHLYLSDPTWPNHQKIFMSSGMDVQNYPYYNAATHEIDFDRMLDFLVKVPERSLVVLHACCHNPTGCDPDQKQWKELSSLFLRRKLIPFFDFAYQGFALNPQADAWAIRYFAEKGHELLVAHSFSKSFGLYGERVGALHFLLKDAKSCHNVSTVLKSMARADYSTPPRHGASLVAIAMHDSNLCQLWEDELAQMRARIQEMRSELADILIHQYGAEKFGFLKKRFGLFSMLGLKSEAVDSLINEHAIYLTKNGRINLTGLNRDNMAHVVSAIAKVVK